MLFERLYCLDKGRSGLPVGMIVGLYLTKQELDLWNEETIRLRCENPYAQNFCRESHFQEEMPLESSNLTLLQDRIEKVSVDFACSIGDAHQHAQTAQVLRVRIEGGSSVSKAETGENYIGTFGDFFVNCDEGRWTKWSRLLVRKLREGLWMGGTCDTV